MSRTITHHQLVPSPLNDAVMVESLNDDNLHYRLSVKISDQHEVQQDLVFHAGPIEEGPNGFSNEALLAVVLDRLENFQKGGCACRENAIVITKLQEALLWLYKRNEDRKERGVAGTYRR